MPKIKRQPMPLHIVCPDTNILWDQDKKHAATPEFNKFWQANLKLIPLKLVVPEVVMGELHFQQTTSAIKIADSIKNQTSELAGITKSNYLSKHSNTKIRNQVEVKLDKWLKDLNGSASPTPITKINWGDLINQAIWRESPFTYDPKNKDNEKGFRDALILETLVDICKINENNSNNIVFLCNDNELKVSAEKRLSGNNKVLIFESLENFGSYIQLSQEQLTNNFVKSIQSHARLKFFTPDNQSSIYYKNNVIRLIKEKFPEDPIFKQDPTKLKGLLGLVNVNQGTISERWWIKETSFKKLIHPNEYCWTSRLTLARLMGNLPSQNEGIFNLLKSNQELQLNNFDVEWKAKVKTDGRFHDISLTDIDKGDSTTQAATDELILRWKLK